MNCARALVFLHVQTLSVVPNIFHTTEDGVTNNIYQLLAVLQVISHMSYPYMHVRWVQFIISI